MTPAEAKQAILETTTLRALSLSWGQSQGIISQVLNGFVPSNPIISRIEDYLGVPAGTIKVELKDVSKNNHTRDDIRELAKGIKEWKCKCPGCGKMHKMKLNWKGRNPVPPMMCKPCRTGDTYEPEISEYAGRYL